jgi:DNA-binding NarL/FixJ family response regulator
VVLTTFEHDQYVVDGLRAGASGFLLKNTPPADLVTAIRTVHDGGALLAPSATRTLIREFTAASPRALVPHPRIGDLTDREREVVCLVAQGMSNHEIAEHLVLSPATARTHVSRAMIKLSARDRAQLVVFAYQSGLA